MFYNSFLALIAVLFGWLMLKKSSKLLRILYGFVWLIFLPNTIYILTDISHLLEDWNKVVLLFKIILIIQYSVFSFFGIVTFIYALYFFQKLFDSSFKILVINFAVGFAMVLGGIERTNSWYVFTNPMRVVNDIFDLISSFEMLMLSLGVGILANIIYFLMLESVLTWGKKFLKK